MKKLILILAVAMLAVSSTNAWIVDFGGKPYEGGSGSTAGGSTGSTPAGVTGPGIGGMIYRIFMF